MAYSNVVNELVRLLKQHDQYENLQEAVDQARSHHIAEIDKLGIRDRTSFLDYMDMLISTWIPSEDLAGKDIYYRLVVFYFIFDQPALKRLQSPIEPQSARKPLTWLSAWLVSYAKEMGNSLDQEGSLTKESLKTFYRSPEYRMDDYIVPRGGWKTFNDFFARSTKPGYRPIADLCDQTVIVSPADSTFDGSWKVSPSSHVKIKHLEWYISDLLQGSPYAEKFEGGLFMHSFLNTFDYHRQHAPVGGKVVEARTIEGQAYLEVKVERHPETGKPILGGHRSIAGKPEGSLNATVSAPDDAGYQFLQLRGLIVLETKIGYVAVLPIGMAQVSSVIVTAEVGKVLRKGEEISYFQFGGSDIVVVFQKHSHVKLSATLNHKYLMGEEIGKASPQ